MPAVSPLAWIVPLALMALAGCASRRATPPGPPDAPKHVASHQSVRYQCAGGTRLEVAYLNLDNGAAFAALTHLGRPVLLRSGPTGSGARYIDLDEQRGLRWHVKGSEGTLRLQPPDHTASETLLLTDCLALPAQP